MPGVLVLRVAVVNYLLFKGFVANEKIGWELGNAMSWDSGDTACRQYYEIPYF